MRTELVSSRRTVIFPILDPGSYPVRAKLDGAVGGIAQTWGRGLKRVDELLAQAGLSMADVDLRKCSS
jgi:hypothetical protein